MMYMIERDPVHACGYRLSAHGVTRWRDLKCPERAAQRGLEAAENWRTTPWPRHHRKWQPPGVATPGSHQHRVLERCRFTRPMRVSSLRMTGGSHA